MLHARFLIMGLVIGTSVSNVLRESLRKENYFCTVSILAVCNTAYGGSGFQPFLRSILPFIHNGFNVPNCYLMVSKFSVAVRRK